MKANRVHLEGIIVYVNDRGDFVIQVGDEFILCRGSSDQTVGDAKTVDGRLRSYEMGIAGRQIVIFYVEDCGADN